MTKQELVLKINDWEENAGESFTDYFMHSNVKDLNWAFWLLGKGFKDKALEIIDLISKGETCIDQDILYEIYSEYDDDFVPYNKNVEIWAEFLVSTPFYLKKVIDFFEEN